MSIDFKNYKDDFFYAVKQNDTNKVQLYLNKGFDVNIKNKSGYTALQISAGYGNKEMVDLLLSNKADINFATNDKTALSFSSEEGFDHISELLLAKGANNKYLIKDKPDISSNYRISWNDVYETTQCIINKENPKDSDKSFLLDCINYFKKLKVPGVEAKLLKINPNTFDSLFNEDMVVMSVDSEIFENLKAYIRAKLYGNVLLCTLYKAVGGKNFSFLEYLGKGQAAFKSPYEKKELLKSKCKSIAEFEEFVLLDEISSLVFENMVK